MYCKDCKFRCENELCHNNKITEDYWSSSDNVDEMRYSYDEGGAFQVGPMFGCVHFAQKQKSPS